MWNNILNAIKNPIQTAKNFVGTTVNTISSTVSSVFNGIWNTVKSIWNGIYNAIKTPIDSAVSFVRSGIDKIKSIFDFKFKWPHIPLPHFSLSGSLNPFDWGTNPPRIGVEWYAKGGILESPTAFGINPYTGNMMVGGEAGPEAIAPIDELQKYVRDAVNEGDTVNVLNSILDLLTSVLPGLRLQVVLDTGTLVGEIVPNIDERMGDIARRKER